MQDNIEVEYGHCGNDVAIDRILGNSAAIVVMAGNYGDYGPSIFTGKDFGCIHFIAKNPTPTVTSLWVKRFG